jgi:CBS domain-containing protein
VGVITAEILRTVAQEPSVANLAIAHDMMVAPAIVQDSADVSSALELLLVHGAREVIVVDDRGGIVGFLDEHEITRLYLSSIHAPTLDGRPTTLPPTRSGRGTSVGS